jgi:hypothetical protein
VDVEWLVSSMLTTWVVVAELVFQLRCLDGSRPFLCFYLFGPVCLTNHKFETMINTDKTKQETKR